MKTNAPSITLTGADEKTDLARLAKLDAEIGLLYTTNPDGRHRYPRWDWIREASLELPRTALHICGSGARRELMEGRLAVSGFQRIQVNGQGLLVLDVERLCTTYPNHTIITQHGLYNAHLLCVRSPNHEILVDGSGGRGISPEDWSAPATDKPVGFAGGLGPANLWTELERIKPHARPGWWVDMEAKLRNIDDWFSLARAEACVEIVAQHNK